MERINKVQLSGNLHEEISGFRNTVLKLNLTELTVKM